jgi:4-hydroxy-tetrahydrodipicolinate synthase
MFAGNETLLLANMRAGGAGCISATANVNPAAIDRLFQCWRNDDAEAVQASLNAVRLAVAQFPLVPALKKTLSHYARMPNGIDCGPRCSSFRKRMEGS